MADIEYYEEDAPASSRAPVQGPSRFGTMVNWAGAIVSLALIVGMAVWAWQLTVRDVAGVPVIRALEGPMRIAPENPGGSQADHQGLAVNRIAEGQEAAPAADRIVLAPPPVELAEIDLSSASLPEATGPGAPTPEAASEATLALIERLIEEEVVPEPPVLMDQDVDVPDAPVDVALDPDPASLDEPSTRAVIAVIDISIPGVRASPRPRTRPETVQVAALAAGAATATDAAPLADVAAAQTPELDADTLAEGTRLVQLGAFDDEATARAEWDRLTRSFPDFFDGRSRIVQPAVSGGRQFFRLRAHGFEDLSDARRFCTTLLAQGAACIPVTVR